MSSDVSQATESAFVHKYSPEQVAHSTALLGREPTGAELAEHHAAPAHGIAGDHPDAVNDQEGVRR